MDDQKTVYAVYPKGHAIGQIVLKRSNDGGKTWSERLPVPESWTHSMECPTLFRMKDAQGKERVFLFSGGYPAHFSVSEDEGETFSEFEPFDFGGIVFLSTMVCIGPGKYIAMFHDEGKFIHGGNETLWEVFAKGEGTSRKTCITIREKQTDGAWGPRKSWYKSSVPDNKDKWKKNYKTLCGKAFEDRHFELYQIETEDGGLTWSNPRIVADHPNARLCEPCIVPSPNGRQLAVIMRENSRKYNSMMMLSNDLGKTWSEPSELPAALTGDRHVMCYLPDGRLFISFRDMAFASSTRGDWVAWVGTYEDLISGKEGQYRILLQREEERDCGYAGIEVLPGGKVLGVTYGQWEPDQLQYIVALQIDIAETDRQYRMIQK